MTEQEKLDELYSFSWDEFWDVMHDMMSSLDLLASEYEPHVNRHAQALDTSAKFVMPRKSLPDWKTLVHGWVRPYNPENFIVSSKPRFVFHEEDSSLEIAVWLLDSEGTVHRMVFFKVPLLFPDFVKKVED